MAIDLEKLSPRELHELIASAQKQIARSVKTRIRQVRGKIQAILYEEGLSFEDVYGSSKRSGKPAAAKPAPAPKYANPDNATQTWSGRGKRPHWFVEALAKGHSESSLQILPSASAAAKQAASTHQAGNHCEKSADGAKNRSKKTPKK